MCVYLQAHILQQKIKCINCLHNMFIRKEKVENTKNNLSISN